MARPIILSGKVCYHCGSDHTSLAGRTSNGKQRYKCRDCNKLFREGGTLIVGSQRHYANGSPSKALLILELQNLAQRLGRAPTTTDVNRLAKLGEAYQLGHYYSVFGSFVKAVKLANLKGRYLQEFDDVQKEYMLEQLRRLSKKLKRPLIGKDIYEARKQGIVSPINHFQAAFGSVPKAMAAAGVGLKLHYDREELIEFMKEIAKELGHPPQKKELNDRFDRKLSPSSRQWQRRFGSIARAHIAAGLS